MYIFIFIYIYIYISYNSVCESMLICKYYLSCIFIYLYLHICIYICVVACFYMLLCVWIYIILLAKLFVGNLHLHRYPGPPGRFRRPGDSKASRQGAHPAGVNGCVPIGYTRIWYMLWVISLHILIMYKIYVQVQPTAVIMEQQMLYDFSFIDSSMTGLGPRTIGQHARSCAFWLPMPRGPGER